MTLPLAFRRRFKVDLVAGFDWYEEQRPGLGEYFLSAVQSTLKSVELHPEIFVSVHGEVRRAIVSRFPFAIFYSSSPNGLSCSGCSIQRATRIFGLDPDKEPPNPALNRTAQKLRFWVPSALRASAAG